MNYKKPVLFIAAALMLCPVFSHAQSSTETPVKKFDYKHAIGIRAGGTSGVTYKHLLNMNNGYELILGIWSNAIGFTGLYEKQAGTGVNGLRFYYGAGGHLTLETNSVFYKRYDNHGNEYVYRYGHNGFAIGVDGIVGIEYKIPVIPMAISFDLKPFIEFSNNRTFYTALDPGLGIKVAF
jgi:hypothetical protein